MKKIILFLVIAVVFATAQTRYLHISTIPAKADIYVSQIAPDYSKKPDYISPQFIPVDGEDPQILVAIFHPEFADTLIDVTLSSKDTSYLIVSLRPLYDNQQLEKQQKIHAKRSKRAFGKTVMMTSLIPLAVSATSSAIALYEIKQAENAKKILNNSQIAAGNRYENALKDFKDSRSAASTARKTAIAASIGAALCLTAGFIISF